MLKDVECKGENNNALYMSLMFVIYSNCFNVN